MQIWPFQRRSKRRASQRRRRDWDMRLGLMRLEERRVLTVNAVLGGVGDVLEIQLSGANEAATITVNAADEIEVRDGDGNQVLIDGNPTAPDAVIHSLRITGDGTSGQSALLESTAGHDLDLPNGAEIAQIDRLTNQLDLLSDADVVIDVADELAIDANASIELTDGQLSVTSGDVSIASSGRLEAELIHLQPQVGVSIGVGQGAVGDWQLDTSELTLGIESNGLLRIGRVGGSESVNIRNADLSSEGYDLEIHGGDINLGGDGAPPTPLYADNTPTADVDGSYSATGFRTLNRNRCLFGSTDFALGGNLGGVATWQFTGLEDGEYLVATSWCDVGSRASNAPFTVSGTGATAATFLVDQRGNANDFSDALSSWEEITVVRISGGAGAGVLTVSVSDDADGVVVADGVRIARAEPVTPNGPDIDVGNRTLRLVAQGGIADLVDSNLVSNDIVAGMASLESATGIGVSGPIETTLTTLAASANVSGGVFILNNGSLQVGAVGAAAGVHAAGSIQIVATGRLEVDRVIESMAGDAIELQSQTDDIVVSADVRVGLGGSGGDAVVLRAVNGAIEGGAGRIINQTGDATLEAQQIGSLSPVLVGVANLEANALSGGVRLHSNQEVTIGGAGTSVIGIQATGDVDVVSTSRLTISEQIRTGGGDLRLVADEDVHVNSTILPAGGEVLLAAGRDVVFSATGRLDAAANLATSAIRVDAGTLNPVGAISMDPASWIAAGEATVHLESAGDVTVSRVVTDNSSNAAISAISQNGRLLDHDDGLPALEAMQGVVVLQSSSGIHRLGDPQLPFWIESTELDVTQSGVGVARVFDANQLVVQRVAGIGGGDIFISSNEELLAPVGADLSMDRGDLLLQSLNSAVTVHGVIQSNEGDVELAAGTLLQFGAVAGVNSMSGDVRLAADVNGVSDLGIAMDDGAQVHVGVGAAELTARGDIVLSQVSADDAMFFRTSLVVRSDGAIVDGGDSLVDLDLNATRADLNAAQGIGVGNALDTNLHTLKASVLTGGVEIDNLDRLTLEQVEAGSEVVSVHALGSLVVDIFGVTGGEIQLHARAGVDADLEIVGAVSGSEAVELIGDRNVILNTTALVTSAGPLLVSADPSNLRFGQIQMLGQAKIVAHDAAELNAAGDVAITLIQSATLMPSVVAVNSGGAVAGSAGLNIDGGHFVFRSQNGVGVADPLDVSVTRIEGVVFGASADIAINNHQDSAVDVVGLTGTGDIQINQTGMGELRLAGPIVTGDGGQILIESQGTLTATSLVSTAATGSGDGELLVQNATLQDGFDPQIGEGDIRLSGGGLDTFIAAEIDFTGINTATLASRRDIVVLAEVQDGVGSILNLRADSNTNGIGGVWLTETGAIHSEGLVALSGTDVSATLESDAIRIDPNDAGDARIQAAQSQWTAMGGDLRVNGLVQGDVTASSDRDILLGDLGALQDGAIQLTAMGPTSQIMMGAATRIDAGPHQVKIEATGDATLTRVQTSLDLPDALVIEVGGDVIDANLDSVNLISAGGIRISANRMGANDRLEVDASRLDVESLEDAKIHSVGDIRVARGVSQATLDLTSVGSLAIDEVGLNAPILLLQSDALITTDGPVEGGDIQVEAREVNIRGAVSATGLAAFFVAQDLEISGAVRGQTVVVETGENLLMDPAGSVVAGEVEVESGANAILSHLGATSSADDALRVVVAGGISQVGGGASLDAPDGGAVLDARTGIGATGGLSTNLRTLSVVNRATGDINIFDDGSLTIHSAEQLSLQENDLTIVATDDLRVDGPGLVVDAATGEVNLVSRAARVIVDSAVQGAQRVVLTAHQDVLLNDNSLLRSEAGNIAVLADFSLRETGGRILMSDGAQIQSDSGLVALRAGGDIVLGGVSSNFDGGAVRVESVGGAILDGGDAHADVAAAGGVQLLAAEGVGLESNPIDLEVKSLAAISGGGFFVHDADDLTLASVGAVTGVTTFGATRIAGTLELSVDAPVSTQGDLTLTTSGDFQSQDVIEIVGADGDLTIQSGGALTIVGGLGTEIVTTGSGIVRLEAGANLNLMPDVEIETDTGFFQSLPLVEEENAAIQIVNQQGDFPLGRDGTAVVQVRAGAVGDVNYLLDVEWLNGAGELSANERFVGVPGGESEISHQFDPSASGLTVTVTFGLDPRANQEGEVVEGVQLFANGESLRPTLSQTRIAFGLGVDNIVLTFESEVEPIEVRPRPSEPPLIITSAGRTTLGSSLPVDQTQAAEEVVNEEVVFFRLVDDATGQELPREYPLSASDLNDVAGIPAKYNLRRGHFRIYLREAGAVQSRNMFDIHVADGRVVPPNYREGASERPPQQPSVNPMPNDEGAANFEDSTKFNKEDSSNANPDQPETRAAAASLGWIVMGRRRVARPLSQSHSKGARLARRVTRRADWTGAGP